MSGCLKRCSYCYAWRESKGRCRHADLRGIPIEDGHEDDPFYPRFHPWRLEEIKRHKEPAGIFICNRSDWAAPYWLPAWQEMFRETILACPQHRFYLLTKQYAELPKSSPYPDNCYVGATVTNTAQYIDATEALAQVEAKVKFLSIEPLLEKIGCFLLPPLLHSKVKWLIIGACTGTREELRLTLNSMAFKDFTPQEKLYCAIFGVQCSDLTMLPYGKKWTLQPQVEWVQAIETACNAYNVPVFLKNNLTPLAEYLRLAEFRQEMPAGMD